MKYTIVLSAVHWRPVLCLLGTPNPLQKAIFAANHHSDLNLHLAIVLIETAGRRRTTTTTPAQINTAISTVSLQHQELLEKEIFFNVKLYIYEAKRGTHFIMFA